MGYFAKKILSKEDLQALAGEIGEIEKKTSGEIRIVLRHRRHFTERKMSLQDLALKEFHKLGMSRTKHKSGVLIFLLVAERKFQIVADEGIHSKVEDGTWDSVAASMSRHFKANSFRKGLSEALQTVGQILVKHVPREGNEGNELSNEVVED